MDLYEVVPEGFIPHKEGWDRFWRLWPKPFKNFEPKRVQKQTFFLVSGQ